jgi:hypothetical protein
MYNSVVPHFDNECEACLNAIKTGLKECLCEETTFDLEDYTRKQAEDFVSCMARGSINKADIRECLVEERDNDDERTVLESLCTVDLDHDSRCLSALKQLRGLDVFRKSDIIEMRLLQCSCKVWGTTYCKRFTREERNRNMNTCIFNFLVEWDPTALKFLGWYENERTEDFHDSFLLQEVMNLSLPETIKLVFKAGLKHFPHELGLLFLESDTYYAPMENIDSDNWSIIKECLGEVGGNVLNLHEPNPRTNLYPFLTAPTGYALENMSIWCTSC